MLAECIWGMSVKSSADLPVQPAMAYRINVPRLHILGVKSAVGVKSIRIILGFGFGVGVPYFITRRDIQCHLVPAMRSRVARRGLT